MNNPLDAAEAFIRRFCALPDEHAYVAVALWTAHAHCAEYFHTSPRLAFLSAEPGSGKSRALEVCAALSPSPMFCFSASPAAVFRTLAEEEITLLVDEADAVFGRHGGDDGREDLRALLNAGYRRGATIPRCVGPSHSVQKFEVFCPVALAGIGDLPETVMTRSVVVRMRRRSPDEFVEPFRERVNSPEGAVIAAELADWADEFGPACGEVFPVLPSCVVDRPAEIWEPLIAIADAAGGDWPERARDAAVFFVKAAGARPQSLGVRLLEDFRLLFGDRLAMATTDIIGGLCNPEEHGLAADAPWADLRGRPIDSRKLSRMLKKYEAAPRKVKADGRSLQGYHRDDLNDAWSRYLAPTPKKAEPAEPVNDFNGLEVPERSEVPDANGTFFPTEPNPESHNALKLLDKHPEIPQVPEPDGGECPRCGGEGCRWCGDDARIET
ncbi:MAG: DUF3631 domain-containing protein [Pseudomonadota bacterium]